MILMFRVTYMQKSFHEDPFHFPWVSEYFLHEPSLQNCSCRTNRISRLEQKINFYSFPYPSQKGFV